MLLYIIAVLAIWRLTHLFTGEDGPWLVMVKLRRALGASFFGKLLDCFYCLSIWFALPFAFYLTPLIRPNGRIELTIAVIVHTLAFSAGAILLERITNPAFTARHPPVYYEEDPP